MKTPRLDDKGVLSRISKVLPSCLSQRSTFLHPLATSALFIPAQTFHRRIPRLRYRSLLAVFHTVQRCILIFFSLLSHRGMLSFKGSQREEERYRRMRNARGVRDARKNRLGWRCWLMSSNVSNFNMICSFVKKDINFRDWVEQSWVDYLIMIWVIWLIYYGHILGVNRYDEYTVTRKSMYTYSSFAIKHFSSYSTFHFHSIKIL